MSSQIQNRLNILRSIVTFSIRTFSESLELAQLICNSNKISLQQLRDVLLCENTGNLLITLWHYSHKWYTYEELERKIGVDVLTNFPDAVKTLISKGILLPPQDIKDICAITNGPITKQLDILHTLKKAERDKLQIISLKKPSYLRKYRSKILKSLSFPWRNYQPDKISYTEWFNIYKNDLSSNIKSCFTNLDPVLNSKFHITLNHKPCHIKTILVPNEIIHYRKVFHYYI